MTRRAHTAPSLWDDLTVDALTCPGLQRALIPDDLPTLPVGALLGIAPRGPDLIAQDAAARIPRTDPYTLNGGESPLSQDDDTPND